MTTGHVQVRHPEFGRYQHLSPVHLAVADAEAVQARLEELPQVAARAAAGTVRPGPSTGKIRITRRTASGSTLAGRSRPPPSVCRISRPTPAPRPPWRIFARMWRLDLFGGVLPDPAARELVLAKTLADELGVSVGDKLTILTRTAVMSTQAWTFRVSGLVGFPVGGLSRVVLLPIGVAQRFLQLDATGAVTDLQLYAARDDQVPDLASAVRDAVAGRLEVRAWTEENAMYRLFQLATRIYDIIALVFFLLATTVIVNTTMMVVYERMREIGTIAALGMTGAQITRLFFLEALFIGVAAALVGVGLGIAVVLPLSQVGIDYTEAMEGVELNMSNIIYPQLSLRSTALVLCYSVAVTAAASFWPTRRAARLHPVTALRAT